jgi:hypothetical protein
VFGFAKRHLPPESEIQKRLSKIEHICSSGVHDEVPFSKIYLEGYLDALHYVLGTEKPMIERILTRYADSHARKTALNLVKKQTES